ncbi:MAG: acyl-CoA dehydrogenase family protein, partial [Pirellulaceae bacterium]|nr:acyl-CoA dehydrogenase family protein [Pirellulaceae bacterium]
MDFSIPAETSDLVARIRAFVEEEIYPLEDSWQKLTFRELLPQLEETRRQVREEGLWTPQIPRSHGGLGLGFLEHALVSEQLA